MKLPARTHTTFEQCIDRAITNIWPFTAWEGESFNRRKKIQILESSIMFMLSLLRLIAPEFYNPALVSPVKDEC